MSYVHQDQRPLKGRHRFWTHIPSLAVRYSYPYVTFPPPVLFDSLMDVEYRNAHAIFNRLTAQPKGPHETTIHVINLDKSVDRWKRLQTLLPLTMFRLERVQGIFTPGHGWIGCAKSMLSVIQKAKDKAWPLVMVAEDDFGPTVDVHVFEMRLATTLAWLRTHPDKWTVFNGLPVGHVNGFLLEAYEDGIVKVNGGQNAHFMIYNASVYDRMLGWFQAYELHKDTPGCRQYLEFDYYASDKAQGGMVSTFPPLTYSWSQDSNIAEHGAKGQPERHREDIECIWRTYSRVESLGFPRLVNMDPTSDITVVVTSCGRWDTLCLTLMTFLATNTLPVKRIVVAEDSGMPWMADRIREYFPDVELLYDGTRRGHLARIQQLWNTVDTLYTFHMEDDWCFRKSFYLETSKRVLEHDSTILNVWLRDITDTNTQPIGSSWYSTRGGVVYWVLPEHVDDKGRKWYGFTWNPTLYRTNDVKDDILHTLHKDTTREGHALGPEELMNTLIRQRGMHSAICPGGFVCHTGERSRIGSHIQLPLV